MALGMDIEIACIILGVFFFLGLKQKQRGRNDSPSDIAKPRPSEGSDSGKRYIMSV